MTGGAVDRADVGAADGGAALPPRRGTPSAGAAGGRGPRFRGCAPSGRRAAGVLCLLLPLVLTAGCGRKGPPRAPELGAPEAVTDLTARVEGRGVRLGWSRPRRTLDGRALGGIGAFVLYRRSTRADCRDCRAAYRERAVIRVEDEGKFFRRSRYGFTDRELRPGTAYGYRVLVRLPDGSASGPSNEVSVEWRP